MKKLVKKRNSSHNVKNVIAYVVVEAGGACSNTKCGSAC